MKLKQIKRLYTEFGTETALSSVCASSFKMAVPWKHRCILRYLKEKYSGLLSGYKQAQSETNDAASEIPGAVWTMWWQGEDDLPDYIMDKVGSGAITITHLSDIIRFALLSQYGGLWLDSTVFVADRIPEDIFTSEYFTVRRPSTPKNGHVAQDRWTSFLQASQKGNLLCQFVFDFFLEYWRAQDYLINYFLVDYTIRLACDELPQCRKLMDAVPVMNDDLYRLEDMMNAKWNSSVFEEIKKKALFSKLSWRKESKKRTFSGEETIYGHLVNCSAESHAQ